MNKDAIGPLQRIPSKRVEFVDLLRGWAVIVMIETHVMNATLTHEVMAGDLFQWVKFINGLVAPSFLFASGFAYAITTHRKLADYLSFKPPLMRQFGRLLFVLLIGYLLHLPKFNFAQLLYQSSELDWQVFFQADVLHCIAVSLLFMQLLLLVLKSERRLYLTVMCVSIGVVFATPLVWGADFSTFVPAPIAAYLNGHHASLFPLFPWSAFLFVGSVTGFLYGQSKESASQVGQGGQEPKMMKHTAWAALGVIVMSFIIEPVASAVYPTYDYWQFSPSFFLLRLGLVLLLCVGMFVYERRKAVSPRSVVTLLGRESLLVYATHLLLIYGNFGTFNFRSRVDHTYGYVEALTATVALFLLMYVLARAWSKIKRGDPRWKRAVELATLVGFLGVFFFGPGN